MIRAVLDTNVLVSGFASATGVSGRLLDAWRAQAYELVISEVIIDEVTRTLAEPYFSRRLTRAQIADNIALLRYASYTDPSADVRDVASHPEDDLILATAVSGQAAYLVTGDRQLLRLGEHSSVAIVSPRQFVDILLEASQEP